MGYIIASGANHFLK